jgi:isopenicillin N synthase-like dioxygenase
MGILTVDYRATDADAQLTTSLKNTGFVVLKNHPIDLDLFKEVYAQWTDFFESDAPAKYPFDPIKQDGYAGEQISEIAKGNDIKDIKEFYHLYFPWGRYPTEIGTETHDLFGQIYTLARKILGWIEAGLPENIRGALKTPLQNTICLERTAFRILYYRALSAHETPGAIRAAAHEDSNMMTVLPAATGPGLQAQDVHGTWHDVNADPETLVINAGGMLAEITNGYYTSSIHRVLNPEGDAARKARLSMPLFLHPYADTYLSEAYPTAEGYLNEYIRSTGIRWEKSKA